MSLTFTEKRFAYTTGGEYKLSGIDYAGYFNINSESIPRTGKIIGDGVSLQSTERIRCDVFASNYYHDRIIVDNLQLPNSLEKTIIPPNEIVTKKSFSRSLDMLYQNTVYLYSNLFISSNILPSGFTSYATVTSSLSAVSTDTNLSWYPAGVRSESAKLSAIGLGELDNVIKIAAIKNTDNNYIIFAISNTHFIALSSPEDRSSMVVSFSSAFIDTNTLKTYNNLNNISLSGNHMILSDDNNYVYKYNISGYTTNDITVSDRKYLIKVMGGVGDITSKGKFNGITTIEIAHNNIYVGDNGNKCIKLYTDNFSWIKTVSLVRESMSIVDISFRESHDEIYVLLKKEKDFYIYVYDKSLDNVIKKIDLNEGYDELRGPVNSLSPLFRKALSDGEEFTEIKFSKQDSNIFYLITPISIYKKFVSKPERTIGKWIFDRYTVTWRYIWNLISSPWGAVRSYWNSLGGDLNQTIILTDFYIIDRNDPAEDIFVFAKTIKSGGAVILYSREDNIYDTALINGNIDMYNSQYIGLNEDEFINAFTINKEIYKQAFNILSIKNMMRGKFIGEFNTAGNLLYKQYEYISSDELENIFIKNIEDMYVHNNEHMSSEVVNRSIRLIHNLQDNILNISKSIVKNISPTTTLSGSNILKVD